MPNFFNLPPFTEDGDVHVVVETPRGSRALTYPHDWGFVPSTKADRSILW
jgi:inorganic pyrophosphatase